MTRKIMSWIESRSRLGLSDRVDLRLLEFGHVSDLFLYYAASTDARVMYVLYCKFNAA